VIVRLLDKNDWLAYKTLRLEALQQHPEAFGPSVDEESKWSDANFKKRLTTCVMFGAFVNHRLVGCAGYYIIPLFKMSHRGEIFFMYTDIGCRQTGVADALLNAVILHAKHRVIQLHLEVSTINLVAKRLYAKNGFKIYGTVPRSR
jgi:ribosomal protein S18 acetylase RimI-like enzyme